MWAEILAILADIAKVIAALEAVFGPSSASPETPLARLVVTLAIANHAPNFKPPLNQPLSNSMADDICAYLSAQAKKYPS
jgi:hypothetical protein